MIHAEILSFNQIAFFLMKTGIISDLRLGQFLALPCIERYLNLPKVCVLVTVCIFMIY